jgi:hypothetical protein
MSWVIVSTIVVRESTILNANKYAGHWTNVQRRMPSEAQALVFSALAERSSQLTRLNSHRVRQRDREVPVTL